MGHLYNNGATDYKIVLPELSSKIEDYAAEELSEIFGVAGVCIKTVRDNNESLAMGGKFIAIGNIDGVKYRGGENIIKRMFK